MSVSAYLDTSAFLKLFLEESESSLVAAAIQESAELFALRLVLTEARVTLARLHRMNRLNRVGYLAALDAVGTFWEREIQVLELTEDVHRAAEHLAEIQPGLRTLDALHAGAAHILCKDLRPEPVSVISCDDRLLQAAAAVGLGTPIPPKADA